MGALDLGSVQTRTWLHVLDGAVLDAGPLLVGLNLEDLQDELAQRLSLELRQEILPQAGGQWLTELAGLGSRAYHLASFDGGATWTPLFEGACTDWDYDPDQQTLSLVFHDPLFEFATHEDQVKYPEGQEGRQVLQDLFERYGFPIGELAGPTAKLPKVVFDGEMGQLLMQVLQHGLYTGDKAYLPRWIPGTPTEGGRVAIVEPGRNDPIYGFDHGGSLLAAHERQSTAEMVREVWLVGSLADDADSGRPPIEQRITVPADDPRPQVGRRVVIKSADYDSPEAATQAAKTLLEERREPARDRSVTVVDVPGVRKGDVVQLRGGTLDGPYTILSVSHDQDARTMALEVGNKGSALYQAQKFPDPASVAAGTVGTGGDCITQELLAYAKSFLGTPYVYSANGSAPGQGMDCSRFVQVVFEKFGITSIGRTTFSQMPNTTPIANGSQRAGDLAFYVCGGNGEEQHVGIMLDAVNMIEETPPATLIAPYTTHGCFVGFYRVPGLAELNAAKCQPAAESGGSTMAMARRIEAYGFSNAPADLVEAVNRIFPAEARANAIRLSHCETNGWTDFLADQGEYSVGYFQINVRAHGGSYDYWMVTENNVQKAYALWRESGNSFQRHWVNCSRTLGLP